MKRTIAENFVIWGTGLDAAKLYYEINEEYKIDFFIDNKNKINGPYIGKAVYCFSDALKRITNQKILVAVPRAYDVIKKICLENELEEFQDFYPGQFLTRKMVVLHGNCHMDIVREYLNSSQEFKKRFFIYDIPRICHENFNEISTSILRNCDVFVHQDIRTENLYGYNMSDEYIRQFLKKDAMDITFPNLFGMGRMFFPQFYWNKENAPLNAGADANGIFPHGDKFLDEAIRNKISIDEICEMIKKDVFSSDEIRQVFNEECKKIKDRELNWDIKCLEFIMDNYKKNKLFFDQGHPTNYLMKYLVVQLLKLLSVVDSNIYSNKCMDEHEEFVYYCVKKELNIEWDETQVRKSSYARKLTDYMDRREYIEEYIWWKNKFKM